MVSGPAWQPPTDVKSWPGAAERDESSLRFESGCRRLRGAREKAKAAGSDKLRGGMSIWPCISPTIRIIDCPGNGV